MGIAKILAPFSVKELDADSRTFSGLAATWDLDLGGDIIHRGAFKRSLSLWRKAKKVLPLIDAHNYGSVRSVIGKMMDAEETESGLEAEFEVIDGGDGDEVLRRLKGGYVDSLSIGYQPLKWDYQDDEEMGFVRHLKEVKLHEVSLVVFPMNPGATIDAGSVKSLVQAMAQDPELREIVEGYLARHPLEKPAPKAEPPIIEDPGDMSDEEIARLEGRMRALRARLTFRHAG